MYFSTGGIHISAKGGPEPGKARSSARAPWRRERATRPRAKNECQAPLKGFIK